MRIISIAILLLINSGFSFSQAFRSKVWVADQGNGTYKNPVLHADYSDPDVIRVGEDYYMTASSFNCVPGLPILHSKDLVNWEIVNYALQDLNLDGVPSGFFDKPQHGKGVWAPCIRYHKGEYMIYWGDPDFGIYVVKTKDILGKWDKPIRVMPGKGRIDPSPLFDDDGKVYLAHAWAGSRARLNSIITVCEMNSEGTKVIGEEVLIFDGNDGINHTIEGGKFYKKNGFYYLLAPAGGVAAGWQLALRSKNIYGPYEAMRVLDQGSTNINGPHQGGLVETQNGEWWFLHFQDKGAYGRITHLQPVNWQDDWPVMGINARKYCGEPVLSYKKPVAGRDHLIVTPKETDEFDAPKLGLQWQWHANPKQSYGFTSSNGYLRMYGQYYPENFINFWDIPNLLLQKFPAEEFSVKTKLSATLLNPGDKTGLIIMGLDYTYLALTKSESGYALEYTSCKDAEDKTPQSVISRTDLTQIKENIKYNHATPIPDVTIYLKTDISKGGVCCFSYSLDGKKYVKLSPNFTARKGKWIGAKVGIFIMNDQENSSRSWVDIDWFRIEKYN